MKLINKKGGDFAPAPADVHRAVCVDQYERDPRPNRAGKMMPKINLVFELPHALMDDGRPFIVFREFTASLSETAHLAAFLAKWLRQGVLFGEGEEFDMENIVGKSALLVVSNELSKKNGKTYANINLAMPCAEQVRPSGHYKRKEPKQFGSAAPQPVPPPVQPRPVTPAAGRTAFQFFAPNPEPLPTTAELAPKLVATEEQKTKFLAVLAPIHGNAAKYFFALGAIGREQPLEELPISYCPATKVQFDNAMESIRAFIDAQQSVTVTTEDDVPF